MLRIQFNITSILNDLQSLVYRMPIILFSHYKLLNKHLNAYFINQVTVFERRFFPSEVDHLMIETRAEVSKQWSGNKSFSYQTYSL